MGIRAEESPARAKKQQLRLNAGNSVADREWYDWLPIQVRSSQIAVQVLRGDAAIAAQETLQLAVAAIDRLNVEGIPDPLSGRKVQGFVANAHLSEAEVFQTIAEAGQKPHWAYGVGMSRLSCVFCIMANRQDLQTAARHNPDLYREYVRLERRIGHTLSMDRRPLDEVVGIPVDDERRAA